MQACFSIGGGSLLAKLKIQNLAAGSGQILNFEFCGVGSQSVGRSPSSLFLQNSKFKIWPRGAAEIRILIFVASGLNRRRRRVASVAVVASKRGGGSLLAKFKIRNLATGSGQILNFAASGLNRRRRRVVSRRVASCRIGRWRLRKVST